MAVGLGVSSSSSRDGPVTGLPYPTVHRPWLSLYGMRVRPVAPVGSTSSQPQKDSSLLHRTLPDELLLEVFARMSPIVLGQAMCVCRQWRFAARSPVFWRAACLKAWQATGAEENEKMLQKLYGGSWRQMWSLRPRLRTDGVYVSRNTYVRTGIMEWSVRNPVHLVCYYRYLRFQPSGRFFYKTSPHRIKEVARSLHGRASKAENVLVGQSTLVDNKVDAAILYPGNRPTVLRLKLRVRGTCQGANNRLDVVNILTSGMDESEVPPESEDVLPIIAGWEDDESHHPDVPAISHRRGLAPFVFVPWEEVDTSDLNLPVDKMDFYVPG
eukprot:SM000145S00790  [mRNA]  locus=s145:38717:41309:- [translate_table: standard]